MGVGLEDGIRLLQTADHPPSSGYTMHAGANRHLCISLIDCDIQAQSGQNLFYHFYLVIVYNQSNQLWRQVRSNLC